MEAQAIVWFTTQDWASFSWPRKVAIRIIRDPVRAAPDLVCANHLKYGPCMRLPTVYDRELKLHMQMTGLVYTQLVFYLVVPTVVFFITGFHNQKLAPL